MAMTRLIVNADDYGLTPGVSAGIRHAHANGIVTCTTAMMIFPNLEDDLRRAQEETPDLGLGVHLVASEYEPLRPAASVRSLLDTNGRFFGSQVYYGPQSAEMYARFDLHELRDEWRAQIERFLALGIPLDHLDSHHHAGYLHESMFSVLLELAREYNVPLRVPAPIVFEEDGRWRYTNGGMLGWHAQTVGQIELPHTNGFFDTFYDSRATVEHLLQIMTSLPEGDWELMCHPGEVDDALLACTSYHTPRAAEIDALCDPRVREALETRGVQLATFAAL